MAVERCWHFVETQVRAKVQKIRQKKKLRCARRSTIHLHFLLKLHIHLCVCTIQNFDSEIFSWPLSQILAQSKSLQNVTGVIFYPSLLPSQLKNLIYFPMIESIVIEKRFFVGCTSCSFMREGWRGMRLQLTWSLHF